MTKATMSTNMEQHSYKSDMQQKVKAEENQQDKVELEIATQTRQLYVDQSNLNKYYLR